MPRLFASDLDGTLLGTDSQLSPETIAALSEVRQRCAEVIAVTGRSPVTARPRLMGHGIIGTAICNNGAVTIDVESGRVLASHGLTTEQLAEAVAAIDRIAPGAGYAWEHDGRFDVTKQWDAHDLVLERGTGAVYRSPPIDTINTTKLIVAHPEIAPIALAAMIAADGATNLEFATSGAPFLEGTAPGVNKGSALAHYCTSREIAPADVVAYGDNHNDVTMLRWAGVGVAVSNAHEPAKAVADAVIGHHGDNSVAQDMLSRVGLRRDGVAPQRSLS